MTTFNVTIPEDKTSFFLEFLELIGGRYEKNLRDMELTDDIKKMLDERLNTDRKEYLPARESLNQLKSKYGL